MSNVRLSSMIDTSCGNLGQVPCNNCKVASSHWIRFTETTYPKLCQQKYKHRNFIGRPFPQSDETFQDKWLSDTIECGYVISIRIYLHGPFSSCQVFYRCFCFFFSDVPCRFLENDKKAPARPRIGLSRNMAHMAPSSPQRLGMNPISLDSPRCVDMAPMLRRKSGAFGC